jgi:hypothetical protein
MGIFGVAKRGFGLLKSGKKSTAKRKFDERRRVLGKAAFQSDIVQTTGKAKKLIKSIKEATARTQRQIDMMEGIKKKRLMTPVPMTKIPKGKKFVGRINPDGTHVRPKKAAGGPTLKLLSKLKKSNKLKGIHGGKAMVGLGAGAAAVGIAARNQIKKFERDVEKAGGLDAYYDKMKKKQGTGPAGGPKKKKKK